MQLFASAKRKHDPSTQMCVLPPSTPPSLQGTKVTMAACVKTVKEGRRMGWNCQLPIVALFFLERGVKIEMEEEEEKKNMQALSAHCHGT